MELERGMVISVNLEPKKGSETGKVRPCVVVTNDIYNKRVPVIQVVPITSWNEKKARIITNVELEPTKMNGLKKKSIADCLQTRPIDHRFKLEKIIGRLSSGQISAIDQALKIIFALE